MKAVILCALFAPILYLAFRQKKWYLYLLFAFIGILPEQFSIKLHDSIPLLTISRILIVVVMAFWLVDKWKTKKFHFPKSLIAFLIVNVIVSLVNLRYGSDDIKRIFLLVFERVFLVIVLADMIHDREEFHRCIDFAIMGCAALAVIGIVQTVFDYDISSALHLTETITSIQLSKRMGLTRAFGTFNAISYGCYCAFMAMLILYRLYNTKSIWHGIAFALNFIALVCSFTRSAWLCLAGIAFIALIFYRLKLIRRLLPSAGIILALLVLLCCLQPRLYSAFLETGKSSINTVLNAIPDSVISLFLPDTPGQPALPGETDPTAPGETDPTEPSETDPTEPTIQRPGFELDEAFGANASDPTYSRTAQWTALEYMAQEGQLLFGYGYNALPKGRIHFFFDRWAAKWQPTTFLDVGLVALFTESGLIGGISYLGLLGYMLVVAFRKKSREEKFSFNHLVLYMIPLYLLLNYLSSFLFAQAVWLFVAMFYIYQKPEVSSLPEAKE